jgi:RHS repeat-associated protein
VAIHRPVNPNGTIAVAANVATDVVVSIQGWYATAAATTAGGTYFAVAPRRVFDSRDGTGTTATRLGAGETRTVTPTVAGVPTSGVAAVTANVTVTTTGSTTSGQFVSVWPTGAWPGTSNLNYVTGQTLAELVMVQTNGDGTFEVRNGADAAVDIIVDVQGYTTIAEDPAGSIYVTGTPTRRYDTRPASGVPGAGTGPMSGTRTVAISGGGGPVPDGSEAVTINVTVTGATAAGTVTLWATGAKPGTANVHYVAGQTVSNAAVVPLDALGRIQVNVTGGATHVVVDVAGYFRGAVNTWTHTYDTNGNRRATTGPPVKWGDSGARSYQWSTAAGLPVLAAETRPWAAGGADTFYWLYGPDHVPVAQVNPNGTLYLLHRDQLGSIALATTTTGAVALSRAWDPYGKPVASTGTALWPIPFGWAGDYRDDSGLINLRARHYDPVTGTFLQRDPLVSVTREAYGYVGGSPLNRTDPSGLIWPFDEDDNTFLSGTCVAFGANGCDNSGNQNWAGNVFAGAGNALTFGQGVDLAGKVIGKGDDFTACYGNSDSWAYRGGAVGALLIGAVVAGGGSAGARTAAAERAGTADFIGFANGPPAVVPNGAIGPAATRASGMQFTGGTGGFGMNSRVTGVRVMDATAHHGRRVVYMNRLEQTVNPLTGRTVSNSSPWAHLPW